MSEVIKLTPPQSIAARFSDRDTRAVRTDTNLVVFVDCDEYKERSRA
jgi:hypothetical protein